MASSLTSTLNFISKQITIYIGIPILIAGIFGGCLNIITFLSLKTFRESPCAFYLTAMSLVNIGQLSTGLFTRIMITGFGIDWTQTSALYCKCRPFLINITSLISSTCLYLATIDQYLATCTRPRWQQWSNIKIAHRLLTIFSIVWLVEQIPTLIYYNQIVSPITYQIICSITNDNFAQFNSYFTILSAWFILPMLISVLFGILAYRNVQQIAYRTVPLIRRELDRQLTVMVLVQVFFNFILLAPNLIAYLLLLNVSLKQNQILWIILNFSASMTYNLFYLNYASPWYIYMSTSVRFRRQLIHVMTKIVLNRVRKPMRNMHQIVPIT